MTGDVYEADGEHHRVLRFDKEGNLLEGWGWGVGNGEAKFERCGPEGEKGPLNEPLYPNCLGREKHGTKGCRGTATGQFSEPAGIAVDSTTGDVFVADSHPEPTDAIQGVHGERQPSSPALRPPEGGSGGEQIEHFAGQGLAVDSAGNVYVVDRGCIHGRRVVEYGREPSGNTNLQARPLHGTVGIAGYLAAWTIKAASTSRMRRTSRASTRDSVVAVMAVELRQDLGNRSRDRGADDRRSHLLLFETEAVPPGEAGRHERSRGQHLLRCRERGGGRRRCLRPRSRALPGPSNGIFYVDEAFDPGKNAPARG